MSAMLERVVADRVRATLNAHGMRCTIPRLRILDALAAADRHLTTAEIFAAVRHSGDSVPDVDLTTVYRTVQALTQIGLVHALTRADEPPRYGLADHRHYHAICTRCAAVTEVDADQLCDALATAAAVSGYRLDALSSLELRAVCPTCQLFETSHTH